MNLVKTTITLPADLLHQAKLAAAYEKTTLNDLIRKVLEGKTQTVQRKKQKKDPMKSLGVFKLGIRKVYNKRSDLYDDHLKRKMGI